MIKSKLSIERVINERHYQFLCPPEASLAEVASILEDIKKYVMGRIEEAEKKQEQEKEPESKCKSECI